METITEYITNKLLFCGEYNVFIQEPNLVQIIRLKELCRVELERRIHEIAGGDDDYQ